MRTNKFSIVYLAGMICVAVSGFFPYFRYRFTMYNAETVKAAYPLLRLKTLQQRYINLGGIGIITRIMPYIILLAGVAGIAIVLIYLNGDRNTWDIFNVNMFIPAAVSLVAGLIVRHNSTIKAIRDVLKTTNSDMKDMGYSGSAGYGIGFYMLWIGILLSVAGSICFFALDKE
jgi:hypothetical protein